MNHKNPDDLEELYHDQGLSTRAIADRMGVSARTIRYWMEKHGIPRRDPGERGQQLSLEERFWGKVDRRGADECWEWQASTYGSGYGRIWDGEADTGAHRLAWRLERGEIGDHYVLHTCDNKLCVNPRHLYLGDPADNMRDAIERGQFNPPDNTGKNNPNATLSETDVLEIRRRYNSEAISQRELGEEFGVTQTQIGRIVNHDRWGDSEVWVR